MAQPPKITIGVELEFLAPAERDPEVIGDPKFFKDRLRFINSEPVPVPEGISRSDPFPDPRWFLQHDPANDTADGRQQTIFSKIVEVLRANGFPAITEEKVFEEDTDLSRLAQEAGITVDPEIDLILQFWMVKNDGSVLMFRQTKDPRDWIYEWHDVEITSPVYNDFGAFTADVTRLVKLLRDNFRLTVNTSAGCHVHVSEYLPGGISLLTAKKSLGLYVCIEDMLLQLCAPHRRSHNWGQPLLKASNLVHHIHSGKSTETLNMDPHDMSTWIPENIQGINRRELREIWQQDSNKDLSLLITGVLAGERLALTLGRSAEERTVNWEVPESLVPSPVSQEKPGEASDHAQPPETAGGIWKRTMEARHLQGTLDPDLICAWSAIIYKLVSLAQLPPEEYEDVIWQVHQHKHLKVFGSPNSIPEFLKDMNLDDPKVVDFWLGQVALYHNKDVVRGPYEPPLK